MAWLTRGARACPLTEHGRRKAHTRVLSQSEGNVDKSLFERKPDNDHCLTDKGRLQAIQAGRNLRMETKDEAVYFQVVPAHYIIEMIRWTGLAPWEFEFSFPGSLTSAFLA